MAPTADVATLDAIFKAYDVRGLVPEQLDADLAQRIGAAFVAVTGAPRVVVGHDMRPTSPQLAAAFATGASGAGSDVVSIGLAATDQLYFASGHLDIPGAMVTASHNPAGYNGIKLCRAGARPIAHDTGLADIRDLVAAGSVPVAAAQGTVTERDVLAGYASRLVGLAPVRGRRLRVVVDAGNGMAGLTVPAVAALLGPEQLDIDPLYFELDGTFPHHEANPIDPDTLVDLQARVVATGADAGLAFDGDADRCFLVDEQGGLVPPSSLTALIAQRELARDPGATVIHNLITSRAVPEMVAELGGTAVRTRVGHSYIKATMAETGAVFGGEHSGHFYFRDFWRADSGLLAALHVLAALAESDRPLSALLARYQRYVQSGEINTVVVDQAGVLDDLRATYDGRDGVTVDELDGLTVSHRDWWFNVRPSNTEPLLRLNAEGADAATLAAVRDDVLTRIRSHR
ncbi:phosphomannomutase/phosphoglucomutase [Nocardioides sp.]|uniref:phosphomannomutase/phosphoglucomutase n=1 Tax=Nocardioides sp. TaxID=35761 RepID=UPI002ED662A9